MSDRWAETSSANPFVEDVFVDRPDQLPGASRIHHELFAQILDSVESLLQDSNSGRVPVGMGRLFLLSAPGAGYGKSHLAARLRDHLGAIASTLFLPFDRSRQVAWPVVLSSTLRQFTVLTSSRHHSATLLEEFSRYFLSRLVLDCIRSGRLKARECPEDASRVKVDFVALFGPGSHSKILTWLDKRADDLVRNSDTEFSQALGMGRTELAFWTRVFIDLNLREIGTLDRLRGLSNGEARERLLQLLRLAADHRPVMLVADGLDGFHHSDTAGMEIAEILNSVREKVPRSVSLVCVNEDVWSSVFASRLPVAWLDRLSGERLSLPPISPDAATEIVRLRLRRTRLSESAAAKFAQRLGEDHRWFDGPTRLTPRIVLRQASDLWRRESATFLPRPISHEDRNEPADGPIASPPEEAVVPTKRPADWKTDTVSPFAISEAGPNLPPRTSQTQEPFTSLLAPASDRIAPVAPAGLREVELTGIDSIINDIRGTGKTVTSETPDRRDAHDPVRQAPGEIAGPAQEAVFVAAAARQSEFPSLGNANAVNCSGSTPANGSAPFGETAHAARHFTRAALELALAERERELLAGPAPTLDLERLGRFVRKVGGTHAALSQQEERYPSSRSVCLRWRVRGQSVLTGFESPRNLYFWNNLLQQSLASTRSEKIAAFSHPSEPFDPSLFSSFGFSPAVIRGRIDIIEMTDRELAMIYAADLVLQDFEGSSDAGKVAQLITLHLDPLWRRIVQTL